jgi:hypothetical protein
MLSSYSKVCSLLHTDPTFSLCFLTCAHYSTISRSTLFPVQLCDILYFDLVDNAAGHALAKDAPTIPVEVFSSPGLVAPETWSLTVPSTFPTVSQVVAALHDTWHASQGPVARDSASGETDVAAVASDHAAAAAVTVATELAAATALVPVAPLVSATDSAGAGGSILFETKAGRVARVLACSNAPGSLGPPPIVGLFNPVGVDAATRWATLGLGRTLAGAAVPVAWQRLTVLPPGAAWAPVCHASKYGV